MAQLILECNTLNFIYFSSIVGYGYLYLGIATADQQTDYEVHGVYPESIIVHPDYDCEYNLNDLAIVPIETPFTTSGMKYTKARVHLNN